MGCDIHWYMEKKKSDKWELIGELIKEDDQEGYIGDEPYVIESTTYHHIGRDYNLFAALTYNHVRGRSQNTPALPKPRGIPSDTCDEIKAMSDHWEDDAHSRSHFTLKELEEFFISRESILGIPTDLIPVGTLNKSQHEFSNIKKVISFMKEYLSEVDNDPERIRAVFWFDS